MNEPNEWFQFEQIRTVLKAVFIPKNSVIKFYQTLLNALKIPS